MGAWLILDSIKEKMKNVDWNGRGRGMKDPKHSMWDVLKVYVFKKLGAEGDHLKA